MLFRSFLAADMRIPTEGGVYISLRNYDKNDSSAKVIREYQDAGLKIYASEGTSDFLNETRIKAEELPMEEFKDALEDKIRLVINVPNLTNHTETMGFAMRRQAIERGIPVLTCMDTAEAFIKAVKLKQADTQLDYELTWG